MQNFWYERKAAPCVGDLLGSVVVFDVQTSRGRGRPCARVYMVRIDPALLTNCRTRIYGWSVGFDGRSRCDSTHGIAWCTRLLHAAQAVLDGLIVCKHLRNLMVCSSEQQQRHGQSHIFNDPQRKANDVKKWDISLRKCRFVFHSLHNISLFWGMRRLILLGFCTYSRILAHRHMAGLPL